MKSKLSILPLAVCLLSLLSGFAAAQAGREYSGAFEPALIANEEDFEKIVFKKAPSYIIGKDLEIDREAYVTTGRLYDPQADAFLILSLLVEEKDKAPRLFVDLDRDGRFAGTERFPLEQEEENNPYLWKTIVALPVKGAFAEYPLFIRYFRELRTGNMTAGDRLITQTIRALARGKVDVGDRQILVQYEYDPAAKTIDPANGWLGIDADGDGAVDMNELSPEAANADNETIVFRAGDRYFSTKKADVGKNQIILREHDARDYKRVEFGVGREMPDFAFVDFGGKKRKFAEFRGKFVLLDVWGLWCPPCREELPYLLEAHKRFSRRNFEIVGLNTDPLPPASIKKAMDQLGMNWTQARFESVFDLLNKNFRIESFPTTFLIAPDGRIITMSRTERGELSLRKGKLLETLDRVLPKPENAKE